MNKCMCGICDKLCDCDLDGDWEECITNDRLWKQLNEELKDDKVKTMDIHKEFECNGITYRVLLDDDGSLITDSNEGGTFMWNACVTTKIDKERDCYK